MHPNGIPLKKIPSWFCKATINRPIHFTFNRVVNILKGQYNIMWFAPFFSLTFLNQSK